MTSPASSTDHGGWWKLSLPLPGELEESLLWKLPELGVTRLAVLHAPGTPSERELVAWLPQSDWPETDLQQLEHALQPLAEVFAITLPPLRWQPVADEDWGLTWKQHWAPDPVSASLLVLPAWLEPPPEAQGRHVIRIDPGLAFGTGAHPSTRLCLEGLDVLGRERVATEGAPVDRPLAGLRVADLGCGSGLLGLAALALGAEEVWAVDTDPLAIRATTNNAALNGVTTIHAAVGSIEALERQLEGQLADVLLCNILAPVIAELAEGLSRILNPKGVGLLSGLLVSQADELIATLGALGWNANLRASQDPWALLTLAGPKK
ncbi:MAG: 50S ribosomal protein L11 methyltransferase [Cyanobacteriota bacterium]|nr:50S ribosomal protein L11 methyltransferase [Cyanobacteriota bacterium]